MSVTTLAPALHGVGPNRNVRRAMPRGNLGAPGLARARKDSPQGGNKEPGASSCQPILLRGAARAGGALVGCDVITALTGQTRGVRLVRQHVGGPGFLRCALLKWVPANLDVHPVRQNEPYQLDVIA